MKTSHHLRVKLISIVICDHSNALSAGCRSKAALFILLVTLCRHCLVIVMANDDEDSIMSTVYRDKAILSC